MIGFELTPSTLPHRDDEAESDEREVSTLSVEKMVTLFGSVKYGKNGLVYEAPHSMSQLLKFPEHKKQYKEEDGTLLTLDRRTGEFTIPKKFLVISHFTPEQQAIIKITNRRLNALLNSGKVERKAEQQHPPLHARIIRAFHTQTSEHAFTQKMIERYLPEPAQTTIDKLYKAYVIALLESMSNFAQDAPQLTPALAATLRMADTEGFERAFASETNPIDRRSLVLENALLPTGAANPLDTPTSFSAPADPLDPKTQVAERPCPYATVGKKANDQLEIAVEAILKQSPPPVVEALKAQLTQERAEIATLEQNGKPREAYMLYRESKFCVSFPTAAFEEAAYTFANAAVHAVEKKVDLNTLNPEEFERKPEPKPQRLKTLMGYLLTGLQAYHQHVLS